MSLRRLALIPVAVIAALSAAGCGASTRTVTVTSSSSAALTAATSIATTSPTTSSSSQTTPSAPPNPPVSESTISGAGSAVELVFCGGGTNPAGQAFDVRGGQTITSYDLLAGCGASGFNYNDTPAQIQAQDTVHDVASLAPQDETTAATTPTNGNTGLALETSAPFVGEHVELLGSFPGTSATVGGSIASTSTTLTPANTTPIRDTIELKLPEPVSDGEVGGPAIDAAGKVIGVVIDIKGETAWLAPASAIKSLG